MRINNIIILLLAIVFVGACKGRPYQKTVTETASEQIILPKVLLDSSSRNAEPYKLCEQVLTSEAAIDKVGGHLNNYNYDVEYTPVEDIFFKPESDIEITPLVKKVQLMYNYHAIGNHVQHAHQLFIRKTMDDTLLTRKDTIDIVLHDRLVVPELTLKNAFPDATIRMKIKNYLRAYERYDGNDDPSKPFPKAFQVFKKDAGALESLADKQIWEEFDSLFWTWYDKRRYVPEYDSIAVLHVRDDVIVTEEQIGNLKTAIEAEHDIDRRTILVMELFRLDRDSDTDTALYLGEIMESGLYTKYLLEAWLTWRAIVQDLYFGISTYSLIPNRYYDKLRVKCINTILRHIQDSPDEYDLCLLENLIKCPGILRMGSLYGNETPFILDNIRTEMFIQPSVLGYDYLKEETNENV